MVSECLFSIRRITLPPVSHTDDDRGAGRARRYGTGGIRGALPKIRNRCLSLLQPSPAGSGERGRRHFPDLPQCLSRAANWRNRSPPGSSRSRTTWSSMSIAGTIHWLPRWMEWRIGQTRRRLPRGSPFSRKPGCGPDLARSASPARPGSDGAPFGRPEWTRNRASPAVQPRRRALRALPGNGTDAPAHDERRRDIAMIWGDNSAR